MCYQPVISFSYFDNERVCNKDGTCLVFTGLTVDANQMSYNQMHNVAFIVPFLK